MQIGSISPGLSTLALQAPRAEEPATTVATSGDLGPRLVHAGDGSPWTPQGQGYLEGSGSRPGQILTTYSGGRSDGVLLSIQDINQSPDSDADHAVILGGLPSTTAFGATSPPPDKAGGVATDGTHVYVADTEAVYVYLLSDIQASRAGLCGVPVAAVDRIEMPDGARASYLNIKDGKLYIGEFKSTVDALKEKIGSENPPQSPGVLFGKVILPTVEAFTPLELGQLEGHPQMLVYDIDAASGSFDPDQPAQSFEIPFDTQGVAITDQGLLFTRSYGSFELNVAHGLKIDAPHELTFLEREGDGYEAASDASKVADLDYYAEGVNIIEGEVWVTYESAADKYRDKVEPQENIQRIPLADVDIPDPE